VALCAVYLYLLPVPEANKAVRYMTYLSCAGMGRLLLDWLPKHPYSIDMFLSHSNMDFSTQSSPHMAVSTVILCYTQYHCSLVPLPSFILRFVLTVIHRTRRVAKTERPRSIHHVNDVRWIPGGLGRQGPQSI